MRMKAIKAALPAGSGLLQLEDHPIGFYISFAELRAIVDKFETLETGGKCLFLFGLEDESIMTVCALAADSANRISKAHVNNTGLAQQGEEKWPKTYYKLNLSQTNIETILNGDTPC